MNITSSAFQSNNDIPQKYTCQGDNTAPDISISSVPNNAKSLAIELRDPDAPSGDFVHWLIWNIDPATREIKGTEGINDANKVGYFGPCPPSGKHHYQFHLYAINQKLDLPSGADKKNFRNAISSHVIEEAVLVGLYQKK